MRILNEISFSCECIAQSLDSSEQGWALLFITAKQIWFAFGFIKFIIFYEMIIRSQETSELCLNWSEATERSELTKSHELDVSRQHWQCV